MQTCLKILWRNFQKGNSRAESWLLTWAIRREGGTSDFPVRGYAKKQGRTWCTWRNGREFGGLLQSEGDKLMREGN